MAAGSGQYTYHSSIAVGNTAELVTLTGGKSIVEVVNKSTTNTELLYFTVGLEGATPTTAVAAATGTFFVAANDSFTYHAPRGQRVTAVSVVSAATLAYGVHMLNPQITG